jgi:HlyD family secretion protein
MKFKYLSIIMMALACAASLPACNWADNQLHGYIEGQLTFMSSPNDGKLEQLPVHRGQQVKKDDFLFSLEPLPESAELKSATAIINQANANLKDLLYGKRPTEIEAIQSQIKEVKAKITFLSKDHERYKLLLEKSAVDRQKYDQTTQDLAISIANLKELQANLDTAKLPARVDAIKAAEATLSSTQALFDKANWELSEKSVNAPDDAAVFDTYYKVGERVPANRPVLSLLRARDIIAVFFIPEPQLANIHLDQKITLSCDNCKTTYQASIRFISPIAEYTPPVIYSNSARSKLVYRVEANIPSENSHKLHPGQPIDILLEGTGR